MPYRDKPLTVIRFAEKTDESGNTEAVPWEKLSEAEQKELRKKNAERIAAYFNRTLRNDLPRAWELYRKGIIRDADVNKA